MRHPFYKTFYILLFFFLGSVQTAKGQVLISLLFGEKLNSPNLEFGLEGGFNRSNLSGISEAKGYGHFHLGFYFDIRLKNDLWLNTGVRIKSHTGAQNIDFYSLNDPELDAIFSRGTIERKIGYFYVPIHLKYHFGAEKQFFFQVGGQVGLRNRAQDYFLSSFINSEDASFELDIRDHIKGIDAGLSGGLGYKLRKGGVNLGVTYYQGLMNIMKTSSEAPYNYTSKNSNLYLFVRIPIGAGYKESNL